MIIPVCLGNVGANIIGVQKPTTVVSADVVTTELLEVDAKQTAGCCVDDVDNSVSLQVDFISSGRTGILTSLETPNMQSQELGVVSPAEGTFLFSGNIFPGAVARDGKRGLEAHFGCSARGCRVECPFIVLPT